MTCINCGINYSFDGICDECVIRFNEKMIDYSRNYHKKSRRPGSIHCFSKTGIDADDDEHWQYIVLAIENHFGDRFMEIDHNTNFCHVDFTIHLEK